MWYEIDHKTHLNISVNWNMSEQNFELYKIKLMYLWDVDIHVETTTFLTDVQIFIVDVQTSLYLKNWRLRV
jgi:hypothetical protein